MNATTKAVSAGGAALLLALSGAGAAGAASGSGGGGGGGTGGGGGGATSVGAIRPVSVAATCDAGSTIAVSVRKGFAKRVEVQLTMNTVASGVWEIHVDNTTTGQPVLGQAGGLPAGSILLTSLGATVPVGTSVLAFEAVRRDSGNTLDPQFPPSPTLETCRASLTVVGR